MSTIIKIFFAISILLFISVSKAQNLLESPTKSRYTYIYKISDAEAKKIYKKENFTPQKTNLYYNLIDSFPTDKKYEKDLGNGHYLEIYADKNRLMQKLFSVQDFSVFTFDNKTDLVVVVVDKNGNFVSDAEVKIRGKRLKYDKKTKTYVDKKSNKKGMLSVKHNGNVGYYEIERGWNNPAFSRFVRAYLNFFPINLVTFPINTILFWEHEDYNKYHYLRIYYSYYFNWLNVVKKINSEFQFVVYNKSKYLPNDTVRFKSIIMDKKGNLLKDELILSLTIERKKIEIAKIKPYYPGAYEYHFYLHDSLQIKNDSKILLQLEKKNSKVVLRSMFKVEDYELKYTKLELNQSRNIQYKGKIHVVNIRAFDENNLNIQDGKISVKVDRENVIKEFFSDIDFIPNTILEYEQDLNPSGTTTISIHDSLFPKANFAYNVNVKLTTSDNQVASSQIKVDYCYSCKEVISDIETDSIFFIYKNNGMIEQAFGNITGTDFFGNEKEICNTTFPIKIPFSNTHQKYSINIDNKSYNINSTNNYCQLNIEYYRTADSIFINSTNPLGIFFTYELHKVQKKVLSGTSQSINVSFKAKTKDNFYLFINYIWWGEHKYYVYVIDFDDNILNIKSNQPQITFPGKTMKIDLEVTDAKGKPVPNVDLTAHSMTKKFEYEAPTIKRYHKRKKVKSTINNFNLKAIENKQNTFAFDPKISDVNVDSVEYFKFRYPNNKIYRFEYFTEDSTSQISPFVFKNGESVPISIIYVNNTPVYFSWTSEVNYSFPIKYGYNNVKIRTANSEIIIDSVWINMNKKLIFSLDLEKKYKNVTVTPQNNQISTSEIKNIKPYLFAYSPNYYSAGGYLTSYSGVHLLPHTHSRTQYIGPIIGSLSFIDYQNKTFPFYKEDDYKYEFYPEYVKLKCMPEYWYPRYFSKYHFSEKRLDESILTVENILEKRSSNNTKNHANSNIYHPKYYFYEMPNYTGQIDLKINYSKNIEQKELVYMAIVDSNNIFVYPNNSIFNQYLLKGNYQFYFFFSNDRHFKTEKIEIKPDGLNYIKIQIDSLSKNSIEEEIVIKRLINELHMSEYINLNTYIRFSKDRVKAVTSIKGKIEEKDRRTLVSFASIFLKRNGEIIHETETNSSGNYSIENIEYGYYDVEIKHFGYLAFKINNIPIFPNNNTNLDIVIDFSDLRFEKNMLINNDSTNTEIIEEGNTTKGQTLGSEDLQRMSARSAQGIAANVGGVQSVDGEMGSVRGSRVDGTVTYIDGVRVRGSASSPKSAISEINVSTNNDIESNISTQKSMIKDVSIPQDALIFINNQVFHGDISILNPDDIEKIEILLDAEKIKIYGDAGKNGVALITLKKGVILAGLVNTKGADFDQAFMDEAMASSKIRSNFSDYAFWQPRLRTDKDGKASFEVTFPDDVTAWETFYYAMNDKKQSGQSRGLIKSYKPLISQLAIPRFMVTGDTAIGIGKALNYTSDSIPIISSLEIDDIKVFSKQSICLNAVLDSLPLVAANDSLKVKYQFETNSGFFDGEIRYIPVFPIGMEQTEGWFKTIFNDTIFEISNSKLNSENIIHARADLLDILMEEAYKNVNYKYLCNEQIASKIKSLMAIKMVKEFKNEEFTQSKEVVRLIKLLSERRNKQKLWGWWEGSNTTNWITLHVVEALVQAQNQGFNIQNTIKDIDQELRNIFYSSENYDDKIRILKVLLAIKKDINADEYLYVLNSDSSKYNFTQKLAMIELQQLAGYHPNVSFLENHKKKSIYGNVFYSDSTQKRSWLHDDLQITLKAYRILKNDTANKVDLNLIRHYFIENRISKGYWRNTYESANIIETILPDLIRQNDSIRYPSLKISGDQNMEVTKFPFTLKLKPNEKIKIEKKGAFPIYFTHYEKYWNTQPEEKKDEFEVRTFFNQRSDTLQGGKEVKLMVEVILKKDTEYLMINVPIPGGCSYGDKKKNVYFETHREYFRNETAIFCESIKRGTYIFEINLIPRFSGTYHLNPAKVEMMYFPTKNANNGLRKVNIE